MHSQRDALFIAGLIDAAVSAQRDLARAVKRIHQAEVNLRAVYREVLDEQLRVDNAVASSASENEDEDELPF